MRKLGEDYASEFWGKTYGKDVDKLYLEIQPMNYLRALIW